MHLIARSKEKDIVNKILDTFSQVKGAYSICILTDGKLFATRDPYGIRPLALGRLDDSFVFTSETTSFDIINGEYLRDVEPGELIMIDKDVIKSKKVKSFKLGEVRKYKHCIFEFIYFSRPDSTIFGNKVDKVRRKIAKNLALESPPPGKDDEINDKEKKVVIINVPDSSNTATLGYYNESYKKNKNIKLEIGLIRSHYVGRTFIQPGQDKRKMKVRAKFNTVKGVIEGRKVVVVDDSIVRGTTSKLLMDLIKKANPKEIHLRITSPPIISPCYYGMDFPSKNELIANQFNQDIEEIRKELGVDSLEYLSLSELLKSVPYDKPKTEYCSACFDCKYPIEIEEKYEPGKDEFDK